jgi:hypothetical protein
MLGRPAIACDGARFGATEANLRWAEAVAATRGPWMIVLALRRRAAA